MSELQIPRAFDPKMEQIPGADRWFPYGKACIGRNPEPSPQQQGDNKWRVGLPFIFPPPFVFDDMDGRLVQVFGPLFVFHQKVLSAGQL